MSWRSTSPSSQCSTLSVLVLAQLQLLHDFNSAMFAMWIVPQASVTPIQSAGHNRSPCVLVANATSTHVFEFALCMPWLRDDSAPKP